MSGTTFDLVLVPKRRFKPIDLVGVSDWHGCGDFERTPLTDANQDQVRVGQRW